MRGIAFSVLGVMVAAGLWWAGSHATTPATAEPIKVGDARTDRSKAEALAARTAYLGKPMTVAGLALDGKTFSTESLKGKVVLIHFWASWCPDCNAELPSVIQLYQTYHDKGLEIVGISSDVAAKDLREYLTKRPEISWKQLYTPPDSNGRHPLNTAYNVDWMPTLFIIDREGICRSVDGDKDLAESIPN